MSFINVYIIAICVLSVCFYVTDSKPYIRQYYKETSHWTKIQNSMSKHWIAYIYEHIYHSLEVSNRNDIMHTVPDMYQSMWHKIDSRIQFYIQCRLLQDPKYMVSTKLCLPQNYISHVNRLTVFSNPTVLSVGRLTLTLDIHLSMNLTFHMFKLSFKMQTEKPSSKWDWKVGIKQYIIEYFLIVAYCDLSSICNKERLHGVYPAHSRYLIHRKTKLEWRTVDRFPSPIVAYFQVIDSNFVSFHRIKTAIHEKPIQTADGILTHRFTSLWFLTENPVKMYIYRLIALHIYVLIISSKFEIDLLVYNGPDVNTEQLSSRNLIKGQKVFITRTFQASVVITENIKEEGIMQWMRQLTQNIRQTAYTGMKIRKEMPWSTCADRDISFCTLQINTPINQSINITIQKMHYTGPSMLVDTCTYGGVTGNCSGGH